ncbi:BON domain-containing protein [Neorhodopirellula pilleata]|uniref:Periplasmic protein n=1 Tax=Neorhodopirellula pilleata TaxID=2714738 RepID=A0A5C5ZKT3_9BACT|nr:BON domain-containing protein [Neorhodopirellula pilleata]TWT87768.1 periplasmic protein [Neorhodopirellula pilleata]
MRRKYIGLAMAAVATLGPATLAPGQALGGDREIAQAIIERLKVSRDAGELKNFNLDMKVNDGVVLFRGKVNGPEQHSVVLATSKGIEGVQNVVDELQVEPIAALATTKQAKIYRPKSAKIETTGPAMDPANDSDGFDFASALSGSKAAETADQAIIAPVAQLPVAKKTVAKDATPILLPEPIQVASPVVPTMVASSKSVPTTPVTIETSGQPDAAQEVVPGIVLPTAAFDEQSAESAISDEQLTNSVVRAIGRAKAEGHLKNFGVDVNAYDGMIQLEGKAASVQQREFLANIARHAPGARGVRNLIEVAQPTRAAESTNTVAAQPVAHRSEMSQGLQPLPQGDQPRMAAIPQPRPMIDPMPATSMRRSVPAQAASYGGQQVINGEVVVPGSMVTHDGSGGAYAGGYQMGSPVGGQIAGAPMMGAPVPMAPAAPAGAPRYDSPNLPNYAWPGYAAYPNYAALSYPQQYSPSAFPYIGPFYPYPQVPLGWRKVSLEWDDGWWFLDFTDK